MVCNRDRSQTVELQVSLIDTSFNAVYFLNSVNVEASGGNIPAHKTHSETIPKEIFFVTTSLMCAADSIMGWLISGGIILNHRVTA